MTKSPTIRRSILDEKAAPALLADSICRVKLYPKRNEKST